MTARQFYAQRVRDGRAVLRLHPIATWLCEIKHRLVLCADLDPGPLNDKGPVLALIADDAPVERISGGFRVTGHPSLLMAQGRRPYFTHVRSRRCGCELTEPQP